jgi:hypothetical protein
MRRFCTGSTFLKLLLNTVWAQKNCSTFSTFKIVILEYQEHMLLSLKVVFHVLKWIKNERRSGQRTHQLARRELLYDIKTPAIEYIITCIAARVESLSVRLSVNSYLDCLSDSNWWTLTFFGIFTEKQRCAGGCMQGRRARGSRRRRRAYNYRVQMFMSGVSPPSVFAVAQ